MKRSCSELRAALAERRVLTLRGWAGESGDLFAHPKRLFSVVPSLDARDGYRGQNECFRSLLLTRELFPHTGRALILGAGPIGLLILQVAKLAGADPIYVTENPLVRDGLSWASLIGSFRPRDGNFIPLTWLSLAADAAETGLCEAALADAKKDLESNDADRMKAALEKLSKLGAEFYAQAQQAAQAGGPAAEAGEAPKSDKKTEKKADVVDADFEVVDDDKKK